MRPTEGSAVELTWHITDSQGQIMALSFRQKNLKHFKVFPLRSEAELREGQHPAHLAHPAHPAHPAHLAHAVGAAGGDQASTRIRGMGNENYYTVGPYK